MFKILKYFKRSDSSH